MDNVKVSATFVLPGRTLIAEKSISEKDTITYHEEIVYFFYNKKRNTIILKLRDGKPSIQKMNITLESYNYMTSDEGRIEPMSKGMWKQLSKAKRVKLHLIEIGKSINGKLLEFNIFED